MLDFIFTAGNTSLEVIRRSLELFGREVLPRIRSIGESTRAAIRAGAATPA